MQLESTTCWAWEALLFKNWSIGLWRNRGHHYHQQCWEMIYFILFILQQQNVANENSKFPCVPSPLPIMMLESASISSSLKVKISYYETGNKCTSFVYFKFRYLEYLYDSVLLLRNPLLCPKTTQNRVFCPFQHIDKLNKGWERHG